MISSIVRLSSLLLGVALLLSGHGLQLALVPIRAELMGWSSANVGYLSSLYFAGFITGCFVIPPLVSRIGHIRAFATLTATATAVILAFALTGSFVWWLALRFLSGAAIVGLYLVIESWLNSQVSNDVRGSVLAAYTAIVLSGLALGQLLLNAAAPEGERLFIISAILIVLAALPVCLTRTTQPRGIPTARFSPRLVLRTSQSSCVGAAVAGLVTGSFYGLGPTYGLQIGLDIAGVSIMMALGIIGGALLQLPLGRLSDRVDRRRVISGAMLGGAVVATIAAIIPLSYIPLATFFFGAAVMPIYALSLANASDFTEPDSFLEVGTGLLMINGLGSIIGPLITSQLMEYLGPGMFFPAQLALLVLGSVFILFFIRTREGVTEHATQFAPATTAAAQGAIELDPRGEDFPEEQQEIQQEEAANGDDD